MNLKETLFEIVSGTYGITLEQMANALAEQNRSDNLEQISAAVHELIDEGRMRFVVPLDEESEERYRCILPEPEWLQPALQAIMESQEDSWPGGLTWALVPEDHNLIVYPAPYEMEGQEGSGYSFFGIDLSDVLAMFDKGARLSFNSRDYEVSVSIEGNIKGQPAWIKIMDRPEGDDDPVGMMHADGGFEQYEDEVE